jgi:nucleoside-diphosphate-sugar epimerase
MKKVLIIGGTGFIGTSITRKCQNEGHRILLLNRGISTPTCSGEVLKGEATRLGDYQHKINEFNPDAVIHTVAFSEQDATELNKALRRLACQRIVLSSIDGYHACEQMSIGRDSGPQPITEQSEPTPKKYYRSFAGHETHSLDKYDKNLMENALFHGKGARPELTTVFRLPFVYGPRDQQFLYRHGTIISRIIDQQPDFTIGLAEQGRLWTFAYVENIAAAINFSIGHDAVGAKVYNLGDRDVLTWRGWAEAYCNQAQEDFSFKYFQVPDHLLLQYDSHHEILPNHCIIDTNQFRTETGFAEPKSRREAIGKTLAWARQHPDALADCKPNYSYERAIAQTYRQFLKSGED